PEHQVIRAILSGDDEAFLEAEASERRVSGVPPFGRYVGIIVSGRNSRTVEDLARAMARLSGPLDAIGAQLFGPAPAQ
ncbi:MAG: primosomal protein N', partial [Rhodospirillaceae bacterium]|nr:primosomal protein N' [Rhodospirillaceae bacterium]